MDGVRLALCTKVANVSYRIIMKYIDNWKYMAWRNKMLLSVYRNTENSIRAYIQMNVYPQDIEIFMGILMPKFFKINGRVFFDIDGESELVIRNAYSKKDTIRRSETERQKDWNSVNIGEIFLDNLDKTSDTTLRNIAILIKHNWEYYLKRNFSDNEFVVEIYGDDFDPWITFYQP